MEYETNSHYLIVTTICWQVVRSTVARVPRVLPDRAHPVHIHRIGHVARAAAPRPRPVVELVCRVIAGTSLAGGVLVPGPRLSPGPPPSATSAPAGLVAPAGGGFFVPQGPLGLGLSAQFRADSLPPTLDLPSLVVPPTDRLPSLSPDLPHAPPAPPANAPEPPAIAVFLVGLAALGLLGRRVAGR
jgi:hypothetical protein